MFKVLTRILPAGSFARNVSVLTVGTVFAQGLAVLALPLLTRLYTPDDFALLAVYVAIIGIVTVVSCLRYNIAIPLPEDDADGMALLAVSLLAAMAISALLAVPVLLAPADVAALVGQPGLEPYLWMVPLGVLLASAYNALQYWASRKKRFGLVTRTRIERAVGGIGTQAAFGAVAPSPFGLVFGHMLYGGLGVLGLARDLWRKDRHLVPRLRLRLVVDRAHDYRDFPTRSLPAALIDSGYQNFPILLLAGALSDELLGVLFLTIRVVGAPMALIGSSLSQVYLSKAPDHLRAGVLGPLTRRLMLHLLVLGMPIVAILGIIIWISSPWIFGENYDKVGLFSFWMIPWLSMQLISSPVSSIFAITRNQFTWFIFQIIGFILIVGGVFLAKNFYQEIITQIFMTTNAIFYLIIALATVNLTYKIERRS